MRSGAWAFIEVSGPEEAQEMQTPADAKIIWLHRGARRSATRSQEAVAALDFPNGTVHAFVHGEAHFVRALRHHLRTERGMARDQLSISGYWRRGGDDEAWRSSKCEMEP